MLKRIWVTRANLGGNSFDAPQNTPELEIIYALTYFTIKFSFLSSHQILGTEFFHPGTILAQKITSRFVKNAHSCMEFY